MNSGPVAQFMPKASGFAWRSDAHIASTVCPASMVPIGSMVTDTMIGTWLPSSFHKLSKELGSQVPIIVSVTIEPMGTMLAGQTVEAMWACLPHAKQLALGMN